MALAVPTLAGFECTISSGGDFAPGDSCSWWLEADDSYCTAGGANIVYCAEDDIAYEADCASWCPSGIGTCGPDVLGDNTCICESPEVCDATIDDSYNTCSGNMLNYCDWVTGSWEDYDCTAACGPGEEGRCDWDGSVFACICEAGWQWAPGYGCNYIYDYNAGTCSGTNLTYCADDNVIYEVECDAHCLADPYYADSGSCGMLPSADYNGCVCEWATCTWDPYCYDAQFLLQCDEGTGDTIWWDCNAECVGSGAIKGTCDAGGCICI
jgi:hypothetical protein